MKNLEFFKNELKDNLLWFWMPRCLDKQHGGYLNCFSNDGSVLVSTDKYTWSQGRFLWMFSKLSMMESEMFSKEQKDEFLAYAKSGRDFLIEHVLLKKDDWRCVFLMNADGTPKHVDGHEGYDLSISADCFVVMGFAAYARATGDHEAYEFAKKLAESVWTRYRSGDFRSLPYPVSPEYQSHARPMILTNVFCELYRAAIEFDTEYAKEVRLGDTVEIHTKLLKVGTKSFTIEQIMYHEGTVSSKTTIIMTIMDLQTRKAIPVHNELVNALF